MDPTRETITSGSAYAERPADQPTDRAIRYERWFRERNGANLQRRQEHVEQVKKMLREI